MRNATRLYLHTSFTSFRTSVSRVYRSGFEQATAHEHVEGETTQTANNWRRKTRKSKRQGKLWDEPTLSAPSPLLWRSTHFDALQRFLVGEALHRLPVHPFHLAAHGDASDLHNVKIRQRGAFALWKYSVSRSTCESKRISCRRRACVVCLLRPCLPRAHFVSSGGRGRYGYNFLKDLCFVRPCTEMTATERCPALRGRENTQKYFHHRGLCIESGRRGERRGGIL